MIIALVLFTAGMAAPRTQHTRRDVMYAIGGFGVVSAFAPASKAGLLGPFPGEQPKDLGPASDGSLKACPSTPNCFSTSGDEKHSVSPFTYSKSDAMAMDDLLAVLNAYPQAGIASDGGGVIDGGGNKIVTSDPKYIYAQFTSARFGFVDDVEFSLGGGKVAMRSASRQGDSDFGVNAARLKYIATTLSAKGGWKTDLGI